ncbi:MAG: L-arabinose isomerase [Bacteroidota bacterium]|jgi:L-arabinose isomerase|nr:MAG: L-arabinose isomerase [Bacteroidota bacterium]
MTDFKNPEAWFITGSQFLYGEETLRHVADHAQQIAASLNDVKGFPVRIVFKPVLKTPEEIAALCREANNTDSCVGLVAWMHTFSPARMWIGGLKILRKPLLHLHTQFNREIPWKTIDMDFMNLNQSAHGDREFGFIMSRMRLRRKVVVGHWQDPAVHARMESWLRAALAWSDWQGGRYCRFGDNMRQVAVTEGDKVEAEIKFGYAVNGYGVGDLVAAISEVTDQEVDTLVSEYHDRYAVRPELQKGGDRHASLREAARIEAGLRQFLKAGNFKGFTDTFEDLHGLPQLPGIAVQRLMEEGYGFGAEGDWKTAALVRAMKVMATGLKGGNSFMEDYTYHFNGAGSMVLGAHMLEICPSIASGKPSCEIHPLGIGGKADPVRLVFGSGAGPAINASIIDMGNRFRLLVNEVEAVAPEHDLPKLPVARVLWKPMPDMNTGCAAWILAGGAHHTCYSQNLTSEHLEDFAEIAGVEFVKIDRNTSLYQFKNELRWNEVYWNN